MDLVRADVADAARDHDGLVVAVDPCGAAGGEGVADGAAAGGAVTGGAVADGAVADGAVTGGAVTGGAATDRTVGRSVAAGPAGRASGVDLEGAEVSAEGGASELVVERGGAERTVDHDLQRGGDMPRPAVPVLPGLHEVRDAQVRDREPGDARLAPAAAARGRLVADLAAHAGRGAREGEIAVGWLCVSTFIRISTRPGSAE